jgi:hypothetical protein
MVRDGVLVVLPLYFSVFVLELIVVMVPLLFFSHSTSVKGRLEDTLHTKVTVFPVQVKYFSFGNFKYRISLSEVSWC